MVQSDGMALYNEGHASSLVNNRLTKMQSNLSGAGRTLEQNPRRSMCSKCGQFMDSHDKNSYNKVWKHSRSAPLAAQLFAERVQARGHTDRFACDYLRNELKEIEDVCFAIQNRGVF